jgi:hypothetical protein
MGEGAQHRVVVSLPTGLSVCHKRGAGSCDVFEGYFVVSVLIPSIILKIDIVFEN